jgi:hypothetical protein
MLKSALCLAKGYINRQYTRTLHLNFSVMVRVKITKSGSMHAKHSSASSSSILKKVKKAAARVKQLAVHSSSSGRALGSGKLKMPFKPAIPGSKTIMMAKNGLIKQLKRRQDIQAKFVHALSLTW